MRKNFKMSPKIDMTPIKKEQSMSDMLNELEGKLSNQTDIGKAMDEFFKDTVDKETAYGSIDLRSRLGARAIRGHSVINFLGAIKVEEHKNRESLSEGLHILSVSMKRHVLSHQGKSRQEIIDLFKSNADASKPTNNFNMLTPQK